MEKTYEKKGYLLEDFRLFHLRDRADTSVDYHYHEFYKLLFLVSGSGSYYVEGKRYLLKAGDIVLIGSQCVHRPEFESGSLYERIILYISPDFLSRESTKSCELSECFSGNYGHVLRPDEKSRKNLFRHVNALETELSSGRYGCEILGTSILLRLLVETGISFRRREVLKPEPLLPKSRQMQDIVRFLDKHLTEDVRIETLSEQFYLSRYHLMRRFREETGTTIHAYLSERRLLLARELIAQGMSATDACFRCGFRSYASFGRAYAKLFGITPTGREAISDAVMEETYE